MVKMLIFTKYLHFNIKCKHIEEVGTWIVNKEATDLTLPRI